MRTDDLIGLLAKDLAVKPRRPWAVLARGLPLAALAVALIFAVLLDMREDLANPAALWATGLKLGLGLLLAGAGALAALRLARPEAGPARSWLAPIAAAALLVLAAVAELLRLGAGGSVERMLGDSILPCLTLIPLLSLPPLAAFLLALREGAVTRPALAGAFAGLAAAGMGIVIYAAHCDEDSALFIGVWYALAAVISAELGALAGRRALAW